MIRHPICIFDVTECSAGPQASQPSECGLGWWAGLGSGGRVGGLGWEVEAGLVDGLGSGRRPGVLD